jgi:SET domain-containing protein
MLLVKTKLGLSKISGIGLYADTFIPKGTIIWRFVPKLDLKFNEKEYQAFKRKHDCERIDNYIYKSKISGCYILCTDDARFINHSYDANTIDTMDDIEGLTIASKDIFPGEEIVSDYQMFDADFDNYKHLLLSVAQ